MSDSNQNVTAIVDHHCAWWPTGGCTASVDGYCIGGTQDGRCHG